MARAHAAKAREAHAGRALPYPGLRGVQAASAGAALELKTLAKAAERAKTSAARQIRHDDACSVEAGDVIAGGATSFADE